METSGPLAELIPLGRERVFDPRQVMLRQGDPGTKVLVLKEGVAGVRHRMADGSETWLGQRQPTYLLGSRAVMNDDLRSAEVFAMTRCIAVSVERRPFLEYVSDGDRAFRLLREGTRKRDDSDQENSRLLALPTQPRIAQFLLTLTEYAAPQVVEGWSQDELARFVGVSRSTFQPVLSSLIESGAIAVRPRKISITDRNALRRAAEHTSE
ncbi:Crp/Fnr family transcriptional regulator [Streptomyces sp. 6N223]|uniref:Crp/Fnr family transcriptional regulator n=1 Tax=Streptomyces sp. 6N223 TaxID=3457412 RepID=UPI003FD64381